MLVGLLDIEPNNQISIHNQLRCQLLAIKHPTYVVGAFIRCIIGCQTHLLVCVVMSDQLVQPDKAFVVCPYCSKLVAYDTNHPATCVPNMVLDIKTNQLIQSCCFTCFDVCQTYSNVEQTRQPKARCGKCVLARRKHRDMPFGYLYCKSFEPSQAEQPTWLLDEQLLDAVAAIDIDEVVRLLHLGADCNARSQAEFWCPVECRWLRWYSENHKPVPDCSLNANTCLCMCVFRISDCFLGPAEQHKLVNLAKLLVSFGGDCSPALQLFEQRYGPRSCGLTVQNGDTDGDANNSQDDSQDNETDKRHEASQAQGGEQEDNQESCVFAQLYKVLAISKASTTTTAC